MFTVLIPRVATGAFSLLTTSAVTVAAVSTGKIAAAAAVGSVFGAALVVAALRGAAFAWKEERDAEKAKAERIDEEMAGLRQDHAILSEKYETLEGSRDFEGALRNVVEKLNRMGEYAEREHRETMELLKNLVKEMQGTTAALEFVAKQAFPTPLIPPRPLDGDSPERTQP